MLLSDRVPVTPSVSRAQSVEGPAVTYALSPMQAGMVFQALLHDPSGKTSGYDIEQIHVVLEEAHDLEAFRQAWTLVARRHEALSSSFDWTHAEAPRQRAHDHIEVPMEVLDLGPGTSADRARMFDTFRVQDRARGFDLRRPPLQRVTVLLASERTLEFVWTFHHILLDGRSFSTVISEVLTAHAALRDGVPVELPPPPPAFREYVAWLGTRDLGAARAYFRELLRGKSEPTPLPGNGSAPVPSDSETTHGRVQHEVDAAVVERAERAAELTGTTLGTLAQAAWAIVLSRFTGDEDVVFGVMRHGRHSALDGNAKRMVGLLTNTVPVRVPLAGGLDVRELSSRIRAQSIAVRPVEHTPLSEIQRVSEMPRGAALFQTLLLFEDREFELALTAEAAPGREYQKLSLYEQPPFPLTVKVSRGAGMRASITFDRARVSETMAVRLMGALVATLDELSRDPNRRVQDLTALLPQERAKVLFEWNDTARPFPDQSLLHDAFEDRARSQPEAIALEVRGSTVTFRELDERAERLAHALRAGGTGRGQRIGVCLGRSAALIVALLAISKTGAAYLPLDPRYPKDRLQWMVDDGQASLVVTEPRFRGSFSIGTLVVDVEGRTESERVPRSRLPRTGKPEDTCYVIYTSGSTGMPKGVVLSHRAVVNTCDWVNRTLGVSPADRALFVTSPSFDLSVYDVFGVLGAGGTVVVADEQLLSDPERLARTVVERNITLWNSAPAALELVAPFLPEGAASSGLRLVMLSGDFIPLNLIRTLHARAPRARIVSLGGATEAAIWSNWFPVERLDPSWRSVPYGRPIQNCRYHVLDDRRRPVPVGVVGELYIGGACLADGYWNRPELTAERFVADPFRAEPDARLFRTGDLARYFDDGNLEILGRRDRQLKIRGFRVEMAELDAALAGLPGVRSAVSAADQDFAGQKSLIAYVVPDGTVPLTERSVKEGLSQTLPEFMLPARVLFLSALPLSQNGKIDVQALPKPRASSPGARRAGALHSATERKVTAIWERVLRRHPIDLDDDFFALGGHSLLAVQVFNEINRAFGLKIPLAALFEGPTVRLLSARLDQWSGPAALTEPNARWTTLVPIHSQGLLPPFFCVAGVGGNPIGERRLAAALGTNQPVYALQHRGVDGNNAPHRDIRGMAREFLTDIRKAQPRGPYYLGGFSAGGLAAFELARMLKEMGERVALLVLLDTFNPTLPKWSSAERLSIFARLTCHYGARYAAQRLLARATLRAEQFRDRMSPGRGRDFEHRHIALQAAFVAALNAYVPRPYDGNTLLIRSHPSRCPDVDYRPHESNGWRDLVGPEFRIASLDCRHDELLEARVETVAEFVRDGLAAARSSGGRSNTDAI